MKEFLKKLFAYDKFYQQIKGNFLYQSYKKYRAKIANFLYDNPSKDFFVVGVTGTNGKTTMVNLIHKILNENLAPTMMFSTAGIKIKNKEIPNIKGRTTPDCFDLQSFLATAKNNWCKVAVLEASSHGLDQSRFEGIKFDFAVLTNITQEHWDYHPTMEDYAEAKKKLFKYVLQNGKESKYASFCVDDTYGKKRFEEMAFDKKISFSLNNSSVLKATKIEEWLDGTYFEFSYLGQKYSATTYLIGDYNICNILGALSVAAEIGIELPKAIKSIENFTGVVGRTDPVYAENGVKYYIDFAHNPDGLEKALNFAANNKGNGKLIVVCGAPGNRETAKRSLMGNIGLYYADTTIFTDDDPEDENRLKILNDMVGEFNNENILNNDFFVIPERHYAIKFATEIAKPWDIVLITGRGHENTQYTNFGNIPFNDKQVVIDLLKEKNIGIKDAWAVKTQYIAHLKAIHSPQTQNMQTMQNTTPMMQWFNPYAQPQISQPNQPSPNMGMFRPS